MDESLLEKVRDAKSPEELLEIARENGFGELSPENARAYFDALKKSGELSDEELSNTFGGSCAIRSRGQRLLFFAMGSCGHWRCYKCNGQTERELPKSSYPPGDNLRGSYEKCRHRQKEGLSVTCSNCYYCSYERGVWWCNSPEHYNE